VGITVRMPDKNLRRPKSISLEQNAPMKSKLDRNRRRIVVTHKPALAYLVEWKANQKGRRALVYRLSNALVRTCAAKGVPVLLCPHTRTRLFPVNVGDQFMTRLALRG
jgi:hypothetical protein